MNISDLLWDVYVEFKEFCVWNACCRAQLQSALEKSDIADLLRNVNVEFKESFLQLNPVDLAVVLPVYLSVQSGYAQQRFGAALLQLLLGDR